MSKKYTLLTFKGICMNFLLKLKFFILSHSVTSKQPHKIVQIHMRHPVYFLNYAYYDICSVYFFLDALYVKMMTKNLGLKIRNQKGTSEASDIWNLHKWVQFPTVDKGALLFWCYHTYLVTVLKALLLSQHSLEKLFFFQLW